VEEAFDAISEMTWCHQSQIMEWLPWVGRHKMNPPESFEAWKGILRERFARQNKELGVEGDQASEAFMVTAWGEVPTKEQILADFPGIQPSWSPFGNLNKFASVHHED